MQHRSTGILASATLTAVLLGTAGAASAASCAEALLSNPRLTRFSAIVQQAGLAPQVSSSMLTVFAPTNDALNAISSITQMLGGQSSNAVPDFPKLQILVRAHLVQGLHPENDMHGKVTLSTEAV